MPPDHPHPSLLVSILVGALIIWRFYSRIRRMVVRQKLSPVRPWITACVLPLLLIVFATVSMRHTLDLAALFGGAALGAGLGVYGLRLTKFETTPEGMYYTPSAHLGIALSAVLIARVAYRFWQMSATPPEGMPPPGVGPGSPGSPLTLLIFGTLAGYYVTYAIGLIRWARARGD
ncbi:MAG: hypothetical protein JSR66_29180 [Proteobacteria bacterium]|nr:hypothetical protein [Pseudomonadota bacterium]